MMKNTFADACRAPYEAPQTQLIPICMDGGLLNNVSQKNQSPEPWDQGNYNW